MNAPRHAKGVVAGASVTPTTDEPLQTELVRKGLVVPIAFDNAATAFFGGVLRRRLFGYRNDPIAPLFQRTSYFDVRPPREIPRDAVYGGAGPIIYGGLVRQHYGHFLLETCSRLWFAAQRPDLPIVFINATKLESYQRDLLDLFGIKNEIVLTAKPMRFSNLIVPQPGFRIEDFYHPDHARFLACCEAMSDEPERPVWFSRTKLPADHGGLIDEPEIEAMLEDAGWKIVHPELLDLEEQVRQISGVRHLAGVAGSALHSVMLARVPPRQLTIVPRGPTHSPLMQLISDGRGIHQMNIALRPKHVGGVHARMQWRVNNPRRVARLLKNADEAARQRWPDPPQAAPAANGN